MPRWKLKYLITLLGIIIQNAWALLVVFLEDDLKHTTLSKELTQLKNFTEYLKQVPFVLSNDKEMDGSHSLLDIPYGYKHNQMSRASNLRDCFFCSKENMRYASKEVKQQRNHKPNRTHKYCSTCHRPICSTCAKNVIHQTYWLQESDIIMPFTRHSTFYDSLTYTI